MDISIIIPHRNIPDLLKRCIGSIPIKENIEVIIVDDNSDDEIVDFTHFPGLDRPNTRVIFTKEGKGAGYARNIGMKEAQGKWIMFADADDFFLPSAFDIIIEYISTNFDLVFFNTECRMSDNLNIKSHRMDSYINGICKNDDNLLRYSFITPVLKLINSNIIKEHHLYFEEKPVSNDVYFSVRVGYYSKNIKKDLRPIMCITERPDSLVNHEHTKQERIIRIETIFESQKFLNSIGMSKYCADGFKWYFGFHIRNVHDWLNIKYFVKYLYLSKLNYNTLKQLYWAIKNI